jgi:hypothetical protein
MHQSPSATYTIDELAALAYPGLNKIEKKHRVSVIRAADAAAVTYGWLGRQAERPGHPLCYGNPLNLTSYAMWNLRRSYTYIYRSPQECMASLDDPSSKVWAYVQPGGRWWFHVEILKARAAGNDHKADLLQADLTASLEMEAL